MESAVRWVNRTASKPFTKAPYKDNSLGMRIGMTVNNATNYVNSLDIRDANGEPKILTPEGGQPLLVAMRSNCSTQQTTPTLQKK